MIVTSAADVAKALAAYKWTAGLAAKVEDRAEIAELLHHSKDAQEILGFLGALGGQYPIMSAVIRGRFTTEYAMQNGKPVLYTVGPQQELLPIKSFFSLSASTTHLPTITLQTYRTAIDSSGTSTTTPLPWASDPFATPTATDNPSFGRNPLDVLVDASKGEYARGHEAVKKILEEAEGDNKDVTAAAERNLGLTRHFLTELGDDRVPTCDPTTQEPTSRHTICWVFSGTRRQICSTGNISRTGWNCSRSSLNRTDARCSIFCASVIGR
ncbi:MAG: hypothetical protein ACLP01_06095 [Solirubrobacteraceae bacterium]